MTVPPAAAAQGRLLAAFAVGSGRPAVRRLGGAVTGAAVVSEAVIAGVPAMVARPARPGPRPALVLCNGVTRRGRHHPAVRRFAHALARAGHLVVVPDPPGLTRGELGDATVTGLVAACAAVADRPVTVASPSSPRVSPGGSGTTTRWPARASAWANRRTGQVGMSHGG